jgi:ferritin-like metal-binding protein YciE
MQNTFANSAFEHVEIASDRAVMEMAQAAGDTASLRPLGQSLNEVVRMAQGIEQNLGPTVRRDMQPGSQGMKSGV